MPPTRAAARKEVAPKVLPNATKTTARPQAPPPKKLTMKVLTTPITSRAPSSAVTPTRPAAPPTATQSTAPPGTVAAPPPLRGRPPKNKQPAHPTIAAKVPMKVLSAPIGHSTASVLPAPAAAPKLAPSAAPKLPVSSAPKGKAAVPTGVSKATPKPPPKTTKTDSVLPLPPSSQVKKKPAEVGLSKPPLAPALAKAKNPTTTPKANVTAMPSAMSASATTQLKTARTNDHTAAEKPVSSQPASTNSTRTAPPKLPKPAAVAAAPARPKSAAVASAANDNSVAVIPPHRPSRDASILENHRDNHAADDEDDVPAPPPLPWSMSSMIESLAKEQPLRNSTNGAAMTPKPSAAATVGGSGARRSAGLGNATPGPADDGKPIQKRCRGCGLAFQATKSYHPHVRLCGKVRELRADEEGAEERLWYKQERRRLAATWRSLLPVWSSEHQAEDIIPRDGYALTSSPSNVEPDDVSVPPALSSPHNAKSVDRVQNGGIRADVASVSTATATTAATAATAGQPPLASWSWLRFTKPPVDPSFSMAFDALKSKQDASPHMAGRNGATAAPGNRTKDQPSMPNSVSPRRGPGRPPKKRQALSKGSPALASTPQHNNSSRVVDGEGTPAALVMHEEDLSLSPLVNDWLSPTRATPLKSPFTAALLAQSRTGQTSNFEEDVGTKEHESDAPTRKPDARRLFSAGGGGKQRNVKRSRDQESTHETSSSESQSDESDVQDTNGLGETSVEWRRLYMANTSAWEVLAEGAPPSLYVALGGAKNDGHAQSKSGSTLVIPPKVEALIQEQHNINLRAKQSRHARALFPLPVMTAAMHRCLVDEFVRVRRGEPVFPGGNERALVAAQVKTLREEVRQKRTLAPTERHRCTLSDKQKEPDKKQMGSEQNSVPAPAPQRTLHFPTSPFAQLSSPSAFATRDSTLRSTSALSSERSDASETGEDVVAATPDPSVADGVEDLGPALAAMLGAVDCRASVGRSAPLAPLEFLLVPPGVAAPMPSF